MAKLDDGDLDVALLGSTPAATGLASGVAMQTFYVAHMKGTSQGLLVRPEIGSPLDLEDKDVRHALWLDRALPHALHSDIVP